MLPQYRYPWIQSEFRNTECWKTCILEIRKCKHKHGNLQLSLRHTLPPWENCQRIRIDVRRHPFRVWGLAFTGSALLRPASLCPSSIPIFTHSIIPRVIYFPWSILHSDQVLQHGSWQNLSPISIFIKFTAESSENGVSAGRHGPGAGETQGEEQSCTSLVFPSFIEV